MGCQEILVRRFRAEVVHELLLNNRVQVQLRLFNAKHDVVQNRSCDGKNDYFVNPSAEGRQWQCLAVHMHKNCVAVMRNLDSGAPVARDLS
jgi:hypothetical protein